MDHRALIRFAVTFAAISAVGFVSLWSSAGESFLWRLKLTTSSVVATCVSGLGTAARADGSHVHFDGIWIHVIDECTGIYAAILLVAFVIAFPSRARTSALAIAAGLGLVFMANVLRLVSLALLMVHSPGSAAFAHDYLWQVAWAGGLVGFAHAFANRAARMA